MLNVPIHALFQIVQFASVTARNRMVMAPMVTNLASSDDEVMNRQVRYYAERARGGVGTDEGTEDKG